MWKKLSGRAGRGCVALFAAAVVALSLLLPAGVSSGVVVRGSASPPCAWWYGIGDSPSAADVELAARRYDVVVLNAWETAALRRIKRLNPRVTVLVYKDLSSTRNYPGTVDGGVDARYLPTGVGYQAARTHHPEWFAVDAAGAYVQWSGYPQHWQMAVWDRGYQRAWADAVTAEVRREGWDGVLADNDFFTLRWYSEAVLAGTSGRDDTDARLRQGLESLLDVAGNSLAAAGKLLVPNISESHRRDGRWTSHVRHSGGMEENFMMRTGDGLLTFQGSLWAEMRRQSAAGGSWMLLMTHAGSQEQARVGFASAVLLGGPRTCWATSYTREYRNPDWSRYQDLDLGVPLEPARWNGSVWTRRLAAGWVAVNPSASAVTVRVPAGLVSADSGRPSGSVRVPGRDAAVFVRR